MSPSFFEINPMLAKSAQPFDSKDFEFELKWDGTRCILFIDRKNLHLQNRRLRNITDRYPEFQTFKKHLKVKSAVIDGEIVVLENGIPSFPRLQQRDHQQNPDTIQRLSVELPAAFIAFDLLYLNGRSLMKKQLVERRAWLRELFPLGEYAVFSESYAHGKELFAHAVEMGFEGIMAKAKKSPYLPGVRSAHWLKIKKFQDVDAVICGYLEGFGYRSGSFGSLVMGLYHQGKLVHIGRVGTGFDDRSAEEVYQKMVKLRTDVSPLAEAPHFPRKVFWCKPLLVARVKFQEWTKDRHLRVPSFKGLREDKAPEECSFEE